MQPDSPRFTNRLSRESSPYLLQHQHNPVDWYPWGEEAFELARKTDRPIFLSVGYSTCYWCHVMERECFENEAIATLMNEHLVCIKVDREERPDVDQLYMTAVQVMTRQGGWPMSTFLFPDGRPFYAGTYFPPRDAHGRPGFPTLIRAIDDAWRNRRDEMGQSADEVMGIVKQLAGPSSISHVITVDEEWVDSLFLRSVADFDPANGGFGGAPKFPRETLLELLLTYLRVRGPSADPQIAHILRRTLTALADGGIRDHLGGGFHRYSTDAHWLVPHFEITLYDNALLAWCFAEASELLNEPRFAQVADRISSFVLREMTSPDGGFYSAIDAEVDAREGASYLWTRAQVRDALQDRFDTNQISMFLKTFGLDLGPNFADPHHDQGVARTNVLYLAAGPALEADPTIIEMREHLYSVRRMRKQPGTDTKIITSWNGLMIRGLWKTGQVLNKQEYQAAAKRAARFLLDKHRDEHGNLLRISRDGQAKQAAFLDDYADLLRALSELDEPEFKDDLSRLWNDLQTQFGDARGGFFFTGKTEGELLVRQKLASDSPLPSGNASAAHVALSMGDDAAARQTLQLFAGQLQQQAESMSALLQAALLYLHQHPTFTVEPLPGGKSIASPEELAHQAVNVTADWKSGRQVIVQLRIAEGYHLNSRDVDEPLIPTELRVHSGGNIEKQLYPPAKQIQVGQSESIAAYDGAIELSVIFQTPPTVGVQMTLRYQPCTDKACLPVVTHSFELLPVKIS